MTIADDLFRQAIGHRHEQDIKAALVAIENAAQVAPDHPDIAYLHAQILHDIGRPALVQFIAARHLDPDNLRLMQSHAIALADAGHTDDAIKMLEARLALSPDWVDGQKLLSQFYRNQDPASDFTRNFAAACNILPQHIGLRLAWFHILSLVRDWAAARRVIAQGVDLLGAQRAFTIAQIYIDSESGERANDATLFDSVAETRDPGLDLCQTRFWLRFGDPARAEAIASRYIGTPAATAFWPYLSLAWRLCGDPKWQWLDNPDSFIRHFDLDLPSEDLALLAESLRPMHNRKANFLEQSVRGGTQTDGQLFFRDDPMLPNIRGQVQEKVADYIRVLPAPDPDHPLLSPKRSQIRFEGSWSVLLRAQGFHSCHTHPNGWISSAFYVAVPPSSSDHAGWLSFGTPPPELGLALSPFAQIEPKPGRLVLFPSTMWHGTVPFAAGERLSIAFDISRPRSSP
jgi:tetratricopeptide (TPR) repeat protein